MTQFGSKLFAFKPSRRDWNDASVSLTLERLRNNQNAGLETNFVTDNNLMITIDQACEPEREASNATLEELKLLEWVEFLRECRRQNLQYTITTFFAYAEMPAVRAQTRYPRLQQFSEKFGLGWPDESAFDNISDLGRTEMTFEGLDKNQQTVLALSFSSLLLMLLIKRDGADFSSMGKFRRFLREYKRLIGTVSLREISVARYVFATQEDCSGPLDRIRSRVELNFARNRKNKFPIVVSDMCATALNGAFDLLLLNAVNIADTKGLEGRKLDCWVITQDKKLKDFNDLCFSVDMNTGQAGLCTAVSTHSDDSEYWQKTQHLLHDFALEGSKRVLTSLRQRALGLDDGKEIMRKIARLPEIAREVIAFAKAGL